jgi:transaldolase
MKFFVDTAEIGAVREPGALGFIDGVTTSPSPIRTSGCDFIETIREICAEGRKLAGKYDYATEILAADIRGANHLSESALADAEVATCPPHVLKSLAAWPRSRRTGNRPDKPSERPQP